MPASPRMLSARLTADRPLLNLLSPSANLVTGEISRLPAFISAPLMSRDISKMPRPMSSSVPRLSRKSASAESESSSERKAARAASSSFGSSFLYSSASRWASAAAFRIASRLGASFSHLRSLRIWRISFSPSRTPSANTSSYDFSPPLIHHAAFALASSIISVARLTISLSGSSPSMSCCIQIAPSR